MPAYMLMIFVIRFCSSGVSLMRSPLFETWDVLYPDGSCCDLDCECRTPLGTVYQVIFVACSLSKQCDVVFLKPLVLGSSAPQALLLLMNCSCRDLYRKQNMEAAEPSTLNTEFSFTYTAFFHLGHTHSVADGHSDCYVGDFGSVAWLRCDRGRQLPMQRSEIQESKSSMAIDGYNRSPWLWARP